VHHYSGPQRSPAVTKRLRGNYLLNRCCARTPMQWSNEPHAGFTKSDKPHIPVISGGPYGYEHINAAIQRRHPDSLLNWTERIIRMRKEFPR
jgi:maltose alpha-D-glucosyltransferase/alpha-amylase